MYSAILTSRCFTCTPDAAVADVQNETVVLDDRSFTILRPADPDLLLEHPAVLAVFDRDEYMPYWCDLWPASRMLAKAVLRMDLPSGLETLELGCGLGLPGIAALAKGLQVTFSDYDATALEFAARNARLNGFHDFDLLTLDWRQPPNRKFPLILASDLMYEERNVEPVVAFLKHGLSPGGLCLLTDQNRKPAEKMRQALEVNGFQFTTKVMHAGQPGLRAKGTLYSIRFSHAEQTAVIMNHVDE